MTSVAQPSQAANGEKPRPGAPLQTHTIRTGLRTLQWIGALTGILGVLVCLSVGAWRWGLAYTNYGPAVVWRWSVPWFTGALGLTPLAALGFLSLWRTRKTKILVYPSGILYRRAGRSINLPWQEIVAIRTVGPWPGLRLLGVGRPLSLSLETADGRTLRFSQELSDFKSLVDTVKGKVYPPMLRAYTQRFNSGGTLQFGPITLRPEGVQVGQRQLPWKLLHGASLDGGELTLFPTPETKLKPIKLSAAQVPNIDLCFQMIQGVTTE